MESLFGAMSGIFILFGMGYLLLTIFIIVYFFRMANDVRELKETLEEIKRIMVKKDFVNSRLANVEPEFDKKESTPVNKAESEFQIGDLVMNIKSGKQMRIKTINEKEGKYSCYTDRGTVHEGDFDDSEIELFKS